MDVIIREAKREDCQSLLDLSMEITKFHSPNFMGPQVDVKVLEHDIFDAENPPIGFYVAEIDGKVIGYGQYFYTYTMRRGKNMYLQDLYVQEKFRNQKVGEKLMKAIVQKAAEQEIEQVEFLVTNWNPAKNFYIRKGARNMTEEANFHVYYFNKNAMDRIISSGELDQ